MTKVYVLVYDADNGSREDCNIFYSPIEVFADTATRSKRIDYVSKHSQYEVGYRTEDLEFETTHDFELPYNLKPDDDDNDVSDYGAPSDPTQYLFYVYKDESPWNGDTGEDAMSTMIAICPEDYFKKTGYQWDQHTPLDFSDNISEIQEGLFEYEGTIEQARAELLAQGLREDAAYTAFVQKHSQHDDDDDAATVATTVTPHMPPAEAEEDAFQYGDSSWLSVDPAEYFFYATLGKDPTGVRATVAYIVPVRYWDINHSVCDQQGRIDLPDGFELVGVNQYVFNGSPSAARMSLRDLGLVDNMAFADAVARSTE
jgi:hypothetical protein